MPHLPVHPPGEVEERFRLELGPAVKLVQQAALAHPRLAHDGHDQALALLHYRVKRLLQTVQLGPATDHAGVDALHAAPPLAEGARPGPLDDIGHKRLGLAFDGEGFLGRHVELGLHVTVGVVGDEDGARGRVLLQAGGQVDGIAHGGVLDAEVRAHLADDDEAGVDAHAHVKAGEAALLLQAGGILLDTGHDLQAGAHGTFGIVLVGEGCAKEGEDGIAHEPGHGACVADDGLDEEVKGAAHDLHDILGVEGLGHGCGALDVGEEGGDQAALGGHLAAGSHEAVGVLLGDEAQQAVGQEAWGRGWGASGWARRGGQLRTAGETEPGFRGQLGAAVRAGQSKAGTTVQAEPSTLWVLGIALGTVHERPHPSATHPNSEYKTPSSRVLRGAGCHSVLLSLRGACLWRRSNPRRYDKWRLLRRSLLAMTFLTF